jgi:glycerol-3-phosphate acyltransferase PlsY
MYTPICVSHVEYVVRISRTGIIIPKKHTQAIRNNSNSGYSNHIRSTGHAYGSITNTMDIIKADKKEKHLNTLERHHM